jgi:hypothetical protein
MVKVAARVRLAAPERSASRAHALDVREKPQRQQYIWHVDRGAVARGRARNSRPE